MADLVEVQNFDAGIYQLETTDPVEGGPGGIDNRQAQQLANRTAWLKLQQEQHAAAVDPHTQYMTAAESNTVIAAAIAALVNASPATLDTLNELAIALGNDANFATTMTNALAGKAALAGSAAQAFSANTPAQFDTSNLVATMAALQTALGNFRGVNTHATNQVLTTAHAGKLLTYYGSVAGTFTLPLISTFPIGGSISFLRVANSTTNLTINRSAGSADTIHALGNVSAASLTLLPGDSVTLVNDGGAAWTQASGSRNDASMAASLVANGYQKLPSGLIIQWGSVDTNSSGLATITYPIAFPNTVLSGGLCTSNAGLFYGANFSALLNASLSSIPIRLSAAVISTVNYLMVGK